MISKLIEGSYPNFNKVIPEQTQSTIKVDKLVFKNSLNIFSQIGIIILMGISAKNGILIVEFARQLKSIGKKSYEKT